MTAAGEMSRTDRPRMSADPQSRMPWGRSSFDYHGPATTAETGRVAVTAETSAVAVTAVANWQGARSIDSARLFMLEWVRWDGLALLLRTSVALNQNVP